MSVTLISSFLFLLFFLFLSFHPIVCLHFLLSFFLSFLTLFLSFYLFALSLFTAKIKRSLVIKYIEPSVLTREYRLLGNMSSIYTRSACNLDVAPVLTCVSLIRIFLTRMRDDPLFSRGTPLSFLYVHIVYTTWTLSFFHIKL